MTLSNRTGSREVEFGVEEAEAAEAQAAAEEGVPGVLEALEEDLEAEAVDPAS